MAFHSRHRIRCFLMLVCCCCCLQHSLKAQKFHFGVQGSVLFSQVDGDNLRGFNKFGYCGGLLGGFNVSESGSVVVALDYARFGSTLGKEVSTTRLEIDMSSLNVLCAYAVRIGDAWDGNKKFRVQFGPRIQAIQSAQLGKSKDRSVLHRYFVSASMTFGVVLSDAVILDLGYNHCLTNILKENFGEVDKLNPYYLSLGLTYYLYQGQPPRS